MGDRLTANSTATATGGAPLFGVYKYTVIAVSPLGFDLLPTGNGPPLSSVQGGMIGLTTMLALIGSTVLVMFEEGDRSKPLVLSVSIPATAIFDAVLTTSGFGVPVVAVSAIVAPLVAP